MKVENPEANQHIGAGLTQNQNSSQGQEFKLGYGDYLRFRDLVLERTGLHFHEKKRVDLETGLLKSLAESPLAANGNHNLDRYYNLLCDRENPTGEAEMSRLINILTIGETHFFRDEAQFKALAEHVLPALIARKRAAAAAVGPDIQPQLRVWSVGCATGEEPYSLAILLKELVPDIDKWYILILATDINQTALQRAQKAIYSDWSFRENRAKALRPRYFTRYLGANTGADNAVSAHPSRDRYRLRDDIRQMVTFASLNLIEDEYPAIHNNTVSMDLIVCRNVTIYFTEDTTRYLVRKFHEALLDGGWLVVGHAEPSLTIYRAFQTHILSGTVLYQKTGWTHLPHQKPKSSKPPVSLTEGIDFQSPPSAPPETEPRRDTPAPSAPPSSNVDPYQVAGVLLNKGQTQEAIDELHRKLASNPYFVPAHSMLGRAYANLGGWDKARFWCQSALKLNSLQPEAYYVLGLIYEHENRVEAAIEMFKKAIYLDREAPLLHFHLALLYKKAGQARKAKRACLNTISVLKRWPPASIVPDSGGATTKHLLDAAQRVLGELETVN
ncbi:MAG: hypothetical protein JW953_13030 [Anaerolineae bacterium]|nr:hypothetical protein [Anaerolineae bacterium]